MMRLRVCVAIITLSVLCFQSTSSAIGNESLLAVMATKLGEQLVAKQRAKVTALDFTDIQGRASELGRYFADQLAVELVGVKGITVIDRANITAIMAEHQLTVDGLVKLENSKKLGKFAGVEAILIGSIAEVEEQAELTVKAISTETAEVVGAARTRVALTPDLRRMLGRASGSLSAQGGGLPAGRGASASPETPPILVREVGPLTFSLLSITEHRMEAANQSDTLSIRCVAIIENRELARHASIAVNQRLHPQNDFWADALRAPTPRATLVDGSQQAWKAIAIRGLTGILGFSQEDRMRSQRDPSGMVALLRGARLWKNEDYLKKPGDYWSGSFTTIAPGKSITVTFQFIPDVGRGGGKSVESPEWISIDVEFITATHRENDDPTKATSLALNTIQIERIMMPKSDAKP